MNCIGLRAEESAGRARKPDIRVNEQLSKAGRTVYDYLPILQSSESQVYRTIKNAGQEPFWAYGAGNSRLSCVFCILGCRSDLANGRRHRPELFERYVQLEREVGWTMFSGASLRDRVADR